MEKEWVSKMGTFVGTLLCILILPVVVINCTLLFKSHINRERVPNIAGTFPMVVLTDSMYPEFQAGDLIFCHTKSVSDVRPGDVIAFFDPAGNGKSIVTHRVESITTDENGSLAWVTKGDANNAKDNAVVPAKNLAGVYRRRIQGLGNAVVFMQTSKGMMVCVVFPILLFVMYDAVRRNRYEKNRIYAMECERRNQV